MLRPAYYAEERDRVVDFPLLVSIGFAIRNDVILAQLLLFNAPKLESIVIFAETSEDSCINDHVAKLWRSVSDEPKKAFSRFSSLRAIHVVTGSLLAWKKQTQSVHLETVRFTRWNSVRWLLLGRRSSASILSRLPNDVIRYIANFVEASFYVQKHASISELPQFFHL